MVILLLIRVTLVLSEGRKRLAFLPRLPFQDRVATIDDIATRTWFRNFIFHYATMHARVSDP